MTIANQLIRAKAPGLDPRWPDFQAELTQHSPSLILVDSARACGQYLIDHEAVELLEYDRPDAVSDETRAKITTWVADVGRKSHQAVTADVIASQADRSRRSIHERARMLLNALKEWEDKRDANAVFASLQGLQFTEPGRRPQWAQPSVPNCETAGTNQCAMARSESTGWREVETLLAHLASKCLIEEVPDRNAALRDWPLEQVEYRVTVAGHGEAEQQIVRGSRKAFVAMWFHDQMNDAYENGIEPALVYLGYEPVRVDKVLSADDIMAEIFAQITECDLMVADFTHGAEGTRGGVYYEAGYAEALGKPVIMTCRADQSPDIHFDTNHRFHIMWNTPKELRDTLRERIPARVAAKRAAG